MPDRRDSELRIKLILSEQYKGDSDDIKEVLYEDNLLPEKMESD